MHRTIVAGLPLVLICVGWSSCLHGANLRSVALFDGERTGVSGEVINNWGGGFSSGNAASLTLQSAVTHRGNGAYRVDLGPTPAGQSRFFQTFATELKGPGLRNTRDLEYFERFETQLRNDTGADVDFTIELKDHRDSLAHSATKSFSVPSDAGWTQIETELDLGAGWNVTGSPQLDRTYAITFKVKPIGQSASGPVYLDDTRLVEPGPPLDPLTSPVRDLAEALARRTFAGLWGGRSRESGLVPNVSTDADAGALNTTAGLLWALPTAVSRDWVSQTDADAYVSRLADTLDHNRDQTEFLPSRFLNLNSGDPRGSSEESPVDAAFVALGLHRYKNQPGLDSAVAAKLDATVNRFDFSAFAYANGWRLNYTPGSGVAPGAYSGYTTEGKVISLAAELSDEHHFELDLLWNSDTYRTRDYLADASLQPVVYGDTQYRAPFSQALVNLFVDLSDRGVDTYPDAALRVNPWQNFQDYEADTAAYLVQIGREFFFQPDAGQGGPPSGYQAYSLYNLYPSGGEDNEDLFMPWSTALALLSGAPGAEDALRFLLENDLHGPLGLADSARWSTGANSPSSVTAFQDNWNLALSLMALVRYIDGGESGARFLADLPQLSDALDTVFFEPLPGDYNRDQLVDLRDFEEWRLAYGTADLTADGNGDGMVDAADFTVWRDAWALVAESSGPAVPEPTSLLALTLVAALSAVKRQRA
ncbi:hypothetical protein Mal64_32140 [Pseudobythopirellula maris]|uniref:Uncharacterized protein n=1 Tax=Pseudobythopirellula maris TaxID=2527991 RepID=A0A5C5ZJZ0_9BACT|nr:PEP-CTERM sorting domain-containing protein [Pseudobythopirellula maris]TWT87672.1 hypothetical protein Mal64_32140 [Pseudobythopirellula maris]